MLKFLGFGLELFIDEVLAVPKPAMYSASDFQGEHWLIVEADDDPEHLVWICAPISEQALRLVADGVASARDAVSHSLTGTVEIVTVDHGRAVPDRCMCCGAIPADLLPSGDGAMLVAA